MSQAIYPFIHVAAMPGVNEILSDISKAIHESGLYRASAKITYVIVGDIDLLDKTLICDEKSRTIYYSKDVNYCEFPTIQLMHRFAISGNSLFPYFHTKGVTRNTEEVSDWRNLLIYFNIFEWEKRVNDLKYFDTSGVNLLGDKINYKHKPETWAIHPVSAPLHYSGNFWWATGEYLRTLPSPMMGYTPSEEWAAWRHMCEMWVCYNPEGRHACAHWSNVDHYYEKYPETNYRK